MPFLAEHPDSGIALEPKDVSNKFRRRQELVCPHCDSTLKYKKASKDGAGNVTRRSHFWHTDNVGGNDSPGGCDRAGESEEHEQWKMVTGHLLMEGYGKDDYYVEKSVGSKVADVLIKSDAPNKRGIVAEYQHRNRNKDYLATTKNYLKYGYGAHWIFNTMSDYDMLFEAKDDLEPYSKTKLYLGEQNMGKLGSDLIEFGTQIWFDNFRFVVESPEDIGPFVPGENQSLWSGEFSAYGGGRSRYPYLIGPGPGAQDAEPPTDPVTTEDWDWDDVWSTYYADSGGAGMLSHFKNEIENGQFERKGPLPSYPSEQPV